MEQKISWGEFSEEVWETCLECGGTGQVWTERSWWNDRLECVCHKEVKVDCEACWGRGEVRREE